MQQEKYTMRLPREQNSLTRMSSDISIQAPMNLQILWWCRSCIWNIRL